MFRGASRGEKVRYTQTLKTYKKTENTLSSGAASKEENGDSDRMKHTSLNFILHVCVHLKNNI